MKIQAPKGTKDISFEETRIWQYVEQVAATTFELANFEEIRTPAFEYTEVFARGVGDTTDIVNKEMYTFEKGDRSYTLRPENTAGVVRAFINGGFHKRPSPQKLWYKGPMFRYERPQSGRQRQFHQIGIELFGVEGAAGDAEVILIAMQFFKNLKLPNLKLYLNNIGCPACRQDYKDKIKDSLINRFADLCEDCQTRYHKNPLRLLDCKSQSCQEIFSEEPVSSVINNEFICESCNKHYKDLLYILDKTKIAYEFNKKLVRGLDYYNGPVFEITSDKLGAQNTVCGGGRYDGLVSLLGGPKTPGVGWALGMERLISLLEHQPETFLDAYIVSDQMNEAIILANRLRESKIRVDLSFSSTKFGKQLDKANKMNAKFAVILGSEEVEKGYYTIKNLVTGDQYQYGLEGLIACLITNTP
jgi:histidyl-tRNA synthetase